MITMMNKQLGLPEPFPSSPTRPPRYSIRVTRENSFNHIPVCTEYALHKIVIEILGDREFRWINDNHIVTEDGIALQGDIERAIEYKPTEKEKSWHIPSPYYEIVCSINGTAPLPPEAMPAINPKKRGPGVANGTKGNRLRTRREKPPRERIALTKICSEIGTKPTTARKILRRCGVPKPDEGKWGWTWDPDDVKEVKTLIIRNLK